MIINLQGLSLAVHYTGISPGGESEREQLLNGEAAFFVLCNEVHEENSTCNFRGGNARSFGYPSAEKDTFAELYVDDRAGIVSHPVFHQYF